MDDYGTDAREEVFKALRKELEHTPLWKLFRQGLKVRGLEFRLFYPKPRSAASAAAAKCAENRITFRPHFYFGDANHEIDFIVYLNGLPIVALELKHEANQNVKHAVAQFVARDHTHKIFQHPFLYLAADTSEVKAATDPRQEQNFRWHNMGLTNTPTNADEYPVEFLYREVLSQDQLLEALSFFLVRVPERAAEDDKPARPASTIFPRYHQSRLVRRVAEDITAHFATAGDIGKKYLADHSAGSGKTLSICWLADRLHSLFKPGTNQKLVDITCPKLHAEILAAGVFTQKDAADVLALLKSGTDAQVQFQVNAMRTRFQAKLTDWENRKAFVTLLARFAKSFHFLTCFFTYSSEIQEFVTFAEWVGPQLIKAGTVSDLMKQIRATVVTKAAVQYQGVMTSGGPVKLQPGKGKGGAGPVPVNVSVQDVIAQIRAKFDITDQEALYIKQVTEEKIADPAIRMTVQAHRDDRLYLEGPYRGQVNSDIQTTYNARGRYDELADPKYTDTGGIFDIMAVTVIQTQLSLAV